MTLIAQPLIAVLVGVGLATLEVLAFIGYLSCLKHIKMYQDRKLRNSVFISSILKVVLFVFGIGAMCLTPAFLMGQMKGTIPEELKIAFGLVTICLLALSIFLARKLPERIEQ